jgi:hypothetical protein
MAIGTRQKNAVRAHTLRRARFSVRPSHIPHLELGSCFLTLICICGWTSTKSAALPGMRGWAASNVGRAFSWCPFLVTFLWPR